MYNKNSKKNINLSFKTIEDTISSMMKEYYDDSFNEQIVSNTQVSINIVEENINKCMKQKNKRSNSNDNLIQTESNNDNIFLDNNKNNLLDRMRESKIAIINEIGNKLSAFLNRDKKLLESADMKQERLEGVPKNRNFDNPNSVRWNYSDKNFLPNDAIGIRNSLSSIGEKVMKTIAKIIKLNNSSNQNAIETLSENNLDIKKGTIKYIIPKEIKNTNHTKDD